MNTADSEAVGARLQVALLVSGAGHKGFVTRDVHKHRARKTYLLLLPPSTPVLVASEDGQDPEEHVLALYRVQYTCGLIATTRRQAAKNARSSKGPCSGSGKRGRGCGLRVQAQPKQDGDRHAQRCYPGTLYQFKFGSRAEPWKFRLKLAVKAKRFCNGYLTSPAAVPLRQVTKTGG